ncbi:tandem-95 repeat protein [Shewanella gelidimarina]|uniref:tandem-95 repeat protein n=1 Tax=Shewanella gelidimarina TaxID=56813 RepID=UPI00201077FF|nr:tandem-95 repeat protein [Shewanella gelidimarina]MCL1059490.1 tandem-95 repeat protein [Shewanella gelidimarina]
MDRLKFFFCVICITTIFTPLAQAAADVTFDGVGVNANLGQPYIDGDFTFDQDVNGGGAQFIGLINGGAIGNFDNAQGSNAVTFQTTNGSEFSLVSFQMEWAGGDDIYSISAYKDNGLIGSETWDQTGLSGFNTFTPTTSHFDNIDEIRVINNLNAAGFILVNFDNIDVDVAVTPNTAPTTTDLNGDSFTYTEGDGAQSLDQATSATVTDADGGDLNGGNITLTITSGEDAAEDTLSINTAGTISLAGTAAGSNVLITGPGVIGTLGNNIAAGNDFVINLNASATPVHVQTLVQALTYENSDNDNPTTGPRNVRLTINDGDGGTSSNADITVTVAGVNDSPSLTNLAGDNLNYSEGAGAQNIDSSNNATITDVDSVNFNTGSLTITIPTNKDASEDIIGFDNSVTTTGLASASITISATNIGTLTNAISEGNDLIVTFNSNATPTLVQSLVRAITYENSDNVAPTESTRTVRYVLTDGDGGSSGNIDTTIIVSAVNNLPVGTNNTLTPNENTTLTIATADFGYSDLEGSVLNHITITAAPVNGSLWLDTDSSNTINNAESALATNATVSKANLDASLLKYFPNGSTSSSFSFNVNDGMGDAAADNTMTLTVNAQPTVTINQASGQGDPTNNPAIVFDVVFSESVTGFDSSDINLTLDSGMTASVTSVSGGGASYTVTATITAGDGDINANIPSSAAVDGSGALNKASSSTDNQITFDNTPPAAPTGIDLAVGSDLGDSDSDNLTSDNTPSMSGAGETGSTLTLFADLNNNSALDGGEPNTTASVSASSWSLVMPTLSDTDHSLVTFQTDGVGNVSPMSAPLSITVDTAEPTGQSVALDQDPVFNDNQTAVSFQFTNSEVNSHYQYILTSSGGGTPTSGNGTLASTDESITAIDATSLQDGTLTLSVVLTDPAGNAAPAVIDTADKDTSPPSSFAIWIDSAINAANANNFTIKTDVAELNTLLSYSISSSGGTGTVNGSGLLVDQYTMDFGNIDVSSLGDGTLTLSAILTDPNGNSATPSVSTVEKDALGPQITSASLNTGNLKAGDTITAVVNFDDSVLLSGSNSTATLDIGGVSRTATYASGHNSTTLTFSYVVVSGDNDTDGVTLSSVQSNSDTAQDSNGNAAILTFTALTEVNLLVDTSAPGAPTPEQVAQTLNADTLTLSQSGYGEDGITVSLLADGDGNGIADNSTPLASDTVSDGNWSVNANLTQDSDNYFVLRVSDISGNQSDLAIGNFLEDSTAPDEPVITAPLVDLYQTSTAFTIVGNHTEDGIIIGLYPDNDNNGIADNDSLMFQSYVVAGSWSISFTQNENSPFNFVAIASDQAGNTSASVAVATTVHDDIAPDATITALLTKDTTPEVTGTLTDVGGLATLTFTLEDSGGTVYGPYTPDSFSDINSGNWTDNEIDDTLSDDTYDVSITVRDLAGNNQIITEIGSIEVDTQAPSSYSVSINQSRIDTGNETALSFDISSAEVGTQYSYSISDGVNSVTGTGTISSTVQTVDNIDVSSLSETTITLFLTLTDDASNTGDIVNASSNKIYNLSPIISQGENTSVTLSEDGVPTPFSLSLNASDMDGDPLTWSLSTIPSNGSASIVSNNNQASINFSPTANYNGNDSFIVNVSDGLFTASITINITVSPVNDAPTITGSPSTTVNQGASYGFSPAAHDIDSTNLTFQISGKPSWASFNSENGSLTGTPANDDVGTHSNIVITVSDNSGASDSLAAFTITVVNVNEAPEISGVPNSSVIVGQRYTFTPIATDNDVGDVLTFSATNKPAWLTLNSDSGSLTGTPEIEDVGIVDAITLSVSDGKLTSSLNSFAIEVISNNQVPSASDYTVSVEEDTSLAIDPQAEDKDGDSLTYTLVASTSHGELQTNGQSWLYQPEENFHGEDSFTFYASDNEADSEVATVTITVSPVNDDPVAMPDEVSVVSTSSNFYTLSVLGNDYDIDEDELKLIGVSADIGSVTIDNNQLVYQAIEGTLSAINISYMIEDGNKATAESTLRLTIKPSDNNELPLLTLPSDIELNAQSLFTKVELGFATATDRLGNAISVKLLDEDNYFAPGNHQVYWQAEDSEGNIVTAAQTLVIHPLISLSRNRVTAENSEQTVKIYLNGPAATYPLVIPYSVSGTADAGDHNLANGEAVITEGTQGEISFDIFADGEVETDETLIITLDENLNRASQSSTEVLITEANIAPEVSLSVTQDSELTNIILISGEPVILNASVFDANPNDGHQYSWQASDNAITSLATENNQWIFNPNDLTAGVYSFTVVVTDDATEQKSSTKEVYLDLVEQLAELGEEDSDNDLLPDNLESRQDSDGDGIPNYLDNISDCNLLQQKLVNDHTYLKETNPSLCVRKGQYTAGNESGGSFLTPEEVKQLLGEDNTAENIGGIFDFIIYDLSVVGQSANIVIPQYQPLPLNAVYRKFTPNGWVDFSQDDKNTLLSAQGEAGYCPPPGATLWTPGLTLGHWCVQLTIEDGGANDDDGLANGKIVDPGGVAVNKLGNTQPIANLDTITMLADTQVIIDVLANDTDDDNDPLTIINVSANIGQVSIQDDKLSYTSPAPYLGQVIVNYTVDDNKGGTAFAKVKIEVIANTSPIANDDQASTTDKDDIVIDALLNDTDIDNQALKITQAEAEVGTVTITNNQLLYSPKAGFDGLDIINYTITDESGSQAMGQVEVTVNAYKEVIVENSSSGGSASNISILLTLLAAFWRRFGYKVAVIALCSLSSTAHASAWFVETELGQFSADFDRNQHLEATDVLSIDHSDSGWSLGLGYQFTTDWKLTARYIDMGYATANIITKMNLLNNNHQDVSDIGPVLARGTGLDVQYTFWQGESFSTSLQLGAIYWESDQKSVIVGSEPVQIIEDSNEEIDPYFGIQGNFNINESWYAGVGIKRYALSANNVDSFYLIIGLRF